MPCIRPARATITDTMNEWNSDSQSGLKQPSSTSARSAKKTNC